MGFAPVFRPENVPPRGEKRMCLGMRLRIPIGCWNLCFGPRRRGHFVPEKTMSGTVSSVMTPAAALQTGCSVCFVSRLECLENVRFAKAPCTFLWFCCEGRVALSELSCVVLLLLACVCTCPP